LDRLLAALLSRLILFVVWAAADTFPLGAIARDLAADCASG
jgi:hypothetical protein